MMGLHQPSLAGQDTSAQPGVVQRARNARLDILIPILKPQAAIFVLLASTRLLLVLLRVLTVQEEHTPYLGPWSA